MHKKIIIFSCSVLFVFGCGKTAEVSTLTTTNANVGAARTASDSPMVSGHSIDSSAASRNSAVPKSGAKTKWTQSGSPIDASAFDREIAAAEKNLKTKPQDAAAKKGLAEAFLKRGTALTEAGQYASALGDYRSVLKYDAENAAAQTWIKKINEIYDSINREAPSPGEEPPPLPFEKKN